MSRQLLEVTGVWKRLCRRPEYSLRYALADIGRDVIGRSSGEVLRDGEFWALQDVDFEVEAGEVVGVIGHNGAGKSTLINLVSGVILPTVGSVTLHTDRVAVIDPSGGLNPVETGRENATTQLALHGVPADAIEEELRAIESFAEIGDFIDAPVGTYSLGMRLRLAFAVYARLKPDLFIIDEALGGGDIRFRNKFRTFLRDYVDAGGAILLCSHEMTVIQAFCQRCLLLDRGRVIMSGPPAMMIDSYHQLGSEREAEARARGAERRKASARSRGPDAEPCTRCCVHSVTLVAEDGGEVKPCGAVVVEVDVAVAEEIEGVACGIEIGRGDLESLATLAGGYPEDSFTLRPPLTKIRCRIDRLPLAAGNYELRVAVAIPRSDTTLALFGYQDAAATFVVHTDINAASNLMRGRQNLVAMPSSWEVTATEAAG